MLSVVYQAVLFQVVHNSITYNSFKYFTQLTGQTYVLCIQYYASMFEPDPQHPLQLRLCAVPWTDSLPVVHHCPTVTDRGRGSLSLFMSVCRRHADIWILFTVCATAASERHLQLHT